MPPLVESYVQVATDGAGKKVRNMAVQVLLSDGTVGTVYMQVVGLADENGNPVDFVEESDWRVELLDEMRALRIGMQQWLDAGRPAADSEDLLEEAQDYRTSINGSES